VAQEAADQGLDAGAETIGSAELRAALAQSLETGLEPALVGVASVAHDRYPNNHYLPHVRDKGEQDDADERLPALLPLPGVRCDTEPEAGRLLRVLLLRRFPVPAEA
jgi:hypothetical protein